VPVENLIGEENRGFLVIMTNFNSERMFMAAGMEARVASVSRRRRPGRASATPSASASPITR
jgi:alkylation response protein AidB-like acyl-CoA dehydrogenase